MRNCVGEIATATNFRSKIRVVIRTFHIFSLNIAKVYYVNQLSAGRVVRAMRCCHEMRVRVGRRHCCPVRARIFLVTICFLYVSRMSHVRKYSRPLERIQAMVNRSRAMFLVSLICSRVAWRVTDHYAAILDESTPSPTDTRTFRNYKGPGITIFHVFASRNKFYYINWLTLGTIISTLINMFMWNIYAWAFASR